MRTEKELRTAIDHLDDYMHEIADSVRNKEMTELVIDSILYCLNEPVKYNDAIFPEPNMSILNKEVR